MYPGLFNSSYIPDGYEQLYIDDPINHLGPWFCATIFSLLFTGVIIAQMYNYVEEQPRDPWWLQTLVSITFVLCVVESVSVIVIAWREFVKNFGNYFEISFYFFDQRLAPVWVSFTGLLVQLYFVHRGFLLSNNWYFVVAAGILSLTGLAFSTVLLVYLVKSDLSRQVDDLCSSMMFISTVLTDALITGFTCWHLHQQRQMTNFSGTRALLARLITVSMQCAILPLVCAVLGLVFYYTAPGEWVILFNIVLPYFYMINLMFTINSRSGLSRIGQDDGVNVYAPRTLPELDGKKRHQLEHGAAQVYLITTETHVSSLTAP